jgi:hypothetical protein
VGFDRILESRLGRYLRRTPYDFKRDMGNAIAFLFTTPVLSHGMQDAPRAGRSQSLQQKQAAASTRGIPVAALIVDRPAVHSET